MIDAAIFHCNKDSKLHCEHEKKLQRVSTALYSKSVTVFSLSTEDDIDYVETCIE